MKRFFNTAGPNRPEHHYTLPARERLPGVQERVERGEYFVLYAPRQSGKTTTMQAWAEELTAHGQYSALLVSMETGAAFPNDVGAAELAILASWQIRAKYHLPPELCPPAWPDAMPHTRIQSALRAWTKASPRPLVVFVDEIDALQDEALFSVLRQIRAGFIYSREGFPRSMGFVGMRNVRALDFSRQGRHHERIGSFYNIIAEVYRLRDFGEGDVRNLCAQHTEETGQVFLPEAVERVFVLSQGQPWLVNALANEIIQSLVRDRSQAIGIEHVEQAKDILIARRDTHLDYLAEHLHAKFLTRA